MWPFASLILVGALAAAQSQPPAVAAPEPAPVATPAPPAAPDFADFGAWVEVLRKDALAAGISAATVEKALGAIEPQPVVLERDRTQAEFTLTLPQYLERRLNRTLVTLAKKKAIEHKTVLARVARTHDVPAPTVVAVWALESNFGRFSGVRPTIPVLATLAYEGRRGELFRRELLDALRIVDRGDIELAELKGSWAGAMGQPQFLPSSYLKYAQDFDEDGRRNIWSSLPDVFASVAFYLKSNGWQEGQSWGRRVRVPESLVAKLDAVAPLRTEGCRAVRGLSTKLPLSRWNALGVRTTTGAALPKADMEASLLRADGEAFLVYSNYETLLSYNCAHTYALSVAMLSDRLSGAPAPHTTTAKPSTSAKPKSKAAAKSRPKPAPKKH